MREVRSDNDLNELFQEALHYCPSLMISEYTRTKYVGFFKRKELETRYTLYHEVPALDGSPYQARHQVCGSGSKDIVTAYLFGVINGALAQLKNQ